MAATVTREEYEYLANLITEFVEEGCPAIETATHRYACAVAGISENLDLESIEGTPQHDLYYSAYAGFQIKLLSITQLQLSRHGIPK